MLGDAHGVVDTGLVCLGVHPGGLFQILRINAADPGNYFRRILLHHFHQLGIAFGAFVNVLLILQAFGNDHVHHAVEQGHIGAGLDLQEHIGLAAQRDAAGFGHDDLRTLLMGKNRHIAFRKMLIDNFW